MVQPLTLIVEAKDFNTHRVERIVESIKRDDGSGYDKSYYLHGIFAQAGIKNRNGRNYPKSILDHAVAKYKADRMGNNGTRSFGELNHPEGVEINLDRVSHYTTALEWQGNDCIGKAKVIKTHPSGRILESLLEEGLTIGVSTRGLGALAEEASADGSKMVEAYEMIAIDAVADPSAPNGFVDGILEHKRYIVQNDGVILECYNALENKLSVLPKGSNQRATLFTEAMTEFLDGMKKL